MEKVSKKSQNDLLEASRRTTLCRRAAQKVVPPQTDLKEEYFYTVDEKTDYILTICDTKKRDGRKSDTEISQLEIFVFSKIVL